MLSSGSPCQGDTYGMQLAGAKGTHLLQCGRAGDRPGALNQTEGHTRWAKAHTHLPTNLARAARRMAACCASPQLSAPAALGTFQSCEPSTSSGTRVRQASSAALSGGMAYLRRSAVQHSMTRRDTARRSSYGLHVAQCSGGRQACHQEGKRAGTSRRRSCPPPNPSSRRGKQASTPCPAAHHQGSKATPQRNTGSSDTSAAVVAPP